MEQEGVFSDTGQHFSANGMHFIGMAQAGVCVCKCFSGVDRTISPMWPFERSEGSDFMKGYHSPSHS